MRRIVAVMFTAIAFALSGCANATSFEPEAFRVAQDVRAQTVISGSPLDQRVQQLNAVLKGQLPLEDISRKVFSMPSRLPSLRLFWTVLSRNRGNRCSKCPR